MGDFLPRTPKNLRAKLDTTSFILAGEIRNCTNKKIAQYGTDGRLLLTANFKVM